MIKISISRLSQYQQRISGGMNMNTQLKKRIATALAAIALVVCSTSIANAVVYSNVYDLGAISGPNNAIAGDPKGTSFIDRWNFSLGGPSNLSSVVLFFNVSPYFGISGSQMDLFHDVTNSSVPGSSSSFSNAITSTYTALGAGAYYFEIKGNLTGLAGGIYGGNLSVAAAPVPEPEVWAMMLAGLGLFGYRHRRRSAVSALPA